MLPPKVQSLAPLNMNKPLKQEVFLTFHSHKMRLFNHSPFKSFYRLNDRLLYPFIYLILSSPQRSYRDTQREPLQRSSLYNRRFISQTRRTRHFERSAKRALTQNAVFAPLGSQSACNAGSQKREYLN